MAGATFLCSIAVSLTLLLETVTPSGEILRFLRLGYIPFSVFTTWIYQQYWEGFFKTEEQIRNFRWEHAKCTCCERNHMTQEGPQPCDKEVLEKCICNWFGSIEDFEQEVQTQVLQMYQRQVGRSPMGFGWLVGVFTCIWWGELDIAASYGRFRFALGPMIIAVVNQLWVLPAVQVISFTIARRIQLTNTARIGPVCIVSVVLLYALEFLNRFGAQIYNYWLYLIFPDMDSNLRRLLFALTTLPVCAAIICRFGRSC